MTFGHVDVACMWYVGIVDRIPICSIGVPFTLGTVYGYHAFRYYCNCKPIASKPSCTRACRHRIVRVVDSPGHVRLESLYYTIPQCAPRTNTHTQRKTSLCIQGPYRRPDHTYQQLNTQSKNVCIPTTPPPPVWGAGGTGPP